MNPPPTLKMRSLRQPDRAEPKATFLRCLRARSFFLVALRAYLRCLRVSASKSHSRFPSPFHHHAVVACSPCSLHQTFPHSPATPPSRRPKVTRTSNFLSPLISI